ncbi:hypothetical protein C8J47_3709 [Sphingomonas sp. PP-F2F-G114-C0414]|uniref:hypothetical protein n=1 Tax=Sphingomonas sp. PP-F2F-G114-C0414 TaxID=2135662 RepID=UPI000EF920AF|nr:hypothetical protein [Sphingomonas sp. PP-F2F-G114-C0414]RMB25759.1 hypothetical protein C8J47_3709 [Sphingomonas sp. PP-F2F-G114-C0414]
MIDEADEIAREAERAAWERDRYTPLPLDPFGSMPQWASRLPGLGRDQPAPDPAYVFATMIVRPALGPVTFSIVFHDLVASHGTLVLQIVAKPAHLRNAPQPVETRSVALADLAANGGIAHMQVLSRKNMFYAVSGYIYDETDALASAISVSLDRREESDPEWEVSGAGSQVRFAKANPPPLRAQPELVTVSDPTLATPVSQPMTVRQFGERSFTTWMSALDSAPERTGEAWQDAYVLQALQYYGAPVSGGHGLGIETRPSLLPTYFTSQQCAILSASVSDTPHGDDPDALGGVPDAEGVERIELNGLSIPEDIVDFDFLWTNGLPGVRGGREAFPHLVLDCMRCLKLDGIAIHLFDYEGMHAGQYRAVPSGLAYTRGEIERIALSLIAQGQEIAQLTFAADDQRRANHEKPVPFGLIARRRR